MLLKGTTGCLENTVLTCSNKHESFTFHSALFPDPQNKDVDEIARKNSKIGRLVHPQNMSKHINTVTF